MKVFCPICNGINLSYVLFGYPSDGMIEAEATGRFMLGGCIPREEHWFCKDCEKYVTIRTKMPCAFCEQCKLFLSPDDVKIEENDDWICITCNNKIKSKK